MSSGLGADVRPGQSVIPEPVPKDIQSKYVRAAQTLHWLADRGYLDEVAQALEDIRAIYEVGEDGQTTETPSAASQA